jgi:hypothetical protein
MSSSPLMESSAQNEKSSAGLRTSDSGPGAAGRVMRLFVVAAE